MPLVEPTDLKLNIKGLADESIARITTVNDAVEQIVVDLYGENYNAGAAQTVVIDGLRRSRLPLLRRAESITSITPNVTAYLSASGKYVEAAYPLTGRYTIVFTPFNDDAKRKMAIEVGVETAMLAPAGMTNFTDGSLSMSFSGTGLQRVRNAIKSIMGR